MRLIYDMYIINIFELKLGDFLCFKYMKQMKQNLSPKIPKFYAMHINA